MSSSVQDLAQTAWGSFELAFRDNEDDSSQYVRVREGSPEWVTDLVRTAHGDMFPDDFRYQCVWSACECIADADDPEDAAHEWADAFVNVYTSDLLTWLASHLSRVGYCDDAIRDEQWNIDSGIVGLISAGQYNEAREVYDSVLQYLESFPVTV